MLHGNLAIATSSLCVIGFVLLQSLLVSGHTVLANPQPWNPSQCHPQRCKGPVPPEWYGGGGDGKSRNSPENPAAWWKRGQKVRIRWHRNNHGGGFVRFSLVPLSKMHDRNWHTSTGFHYGCFEAYKVRCHGREECGSDKDGYAFYQQVEIPKVFPDGKYVFAMVWYGGVKYDRKTAMFSNYYSASHVVIKGGQSLIGWYRPEFVPVRSGYDGFQGEKVPYGYCLTTSSWVGECRGEPCFHRKATSTIPGNFKNGNKPDGIDKNVLNKAL